MPDDGAQCCQGWRSGWPGPGLAVLISAPLLFLLIVWWPGWNGLSRGWGWGGRPVTLKGWVLTASLLLSTGRHQLAASSHQARDDGEEASGWWTCGHILVQPLRSSGLVNGCAEQSWKCK